MRVDHVQEVPEADPGLQRVSEPRMPPHPVGVASAGLALDDVPSGHQVADDPLYGALGDPHLHRDVAQPDLGITRKGDQDVPVIAEVGPLRLRHRARIPETLFVIAGAPGRIRTYAPASGGRCSIP